MPIVLYKLSGMLQKISRNVRSAICIRKNIQTLPTDTESKPDEINSKNIRPDQVVEKCNYCQRCESCNSEKEKDKSKAKLKREIESRCNTLNNFFLGIGFIIMVASNTIIWMMMSQ